MAADEYTIGWICALPIEKAAARAMLDEIHNTPPAILRSASDKNSYTLGRIGPHSIVVASLPSGVYGETPAATVAAQMLASFPSIRVGVLVGVGGGIPADTNGYNCSRFVRTGALNKPPLVLLNALAELEAEHEVDGSKVPLHIAEMLDRYPRMRSEYSYQGASNDILYHSGYSHREDEDGNDPASSCSSNQVVKDSALRDRIGAEIGAICLEMEAAGLMDSFPCIVIRGVCDYADSHKNKRWQRTDPGQELRLRRHTIKHRVYLNVLPLAEGAAFDSYENEMSPHCHSETRRELLCQINDWSCDRNGKSIFWLNGMAGTGKSTLARTVARSLRADGRLAASFFFKRGEASRGNASRFFTTIASQVASSIPAATEHIQEAVQSSPMIADKGLGIQFFELIVQPLRALKIQLAAAAPVILVVDALNECDDAVHIKTIIRLLSGECMKEINLRVFLTARPDTAVRIGFHQVASKAYDGMILHEVAQETIDHDIRVVLEQELRKIKQNYNSLASSADALLAADWPGSVAIDRLVEIASPLFISAATICRVLSDSRFLPQHQLAMLLEFQSASHASKLEVTYLPVLDQILVGDLTRREKEYLTGEFHRVVGSLIILAEPLSITHLARLLCISRARVETSLASLHAVLRIPADDGPVRLLHASFRDFLLDEHLLEKTPLAIHAPTVHNYLLQHCLLCMSRTTSLNSTSCSENICGLAALKGLDSSLEQDIVGRILPSDLRYSCLYWVYHLKQANRSIQVGDHVHSFLQTHFLDWVEALGILDRPSEILQAVQVLVSLVEKTSKGNVLSEFLHDARRFVHSHKPVIERAPGILHSSVLFLPLRSSIRQNFIYHCPGWICALPEVPQDWGQPTLHVDGFALNCLAFAEDSSKLASEFRVWNAISGDVLHAVARYKPKSTLGPKHDYQYGIKALAFKSAHELAIVTRGGQLQSFNLITGDRIERTLDSAVHTAVFSGDANRLAFIGCSNPFKVSQTQPTDPTVVVIDNVSGQVILRLPNMGYPLLSLSSDGSTLACCVLSNAESTETAHVKVFDLTKENLRSHVRAPKVISVPFMYVSMITLSRNGQKLAIFGEEAKAPVVLVLDIGKYKYERFLPVLAKVSCMSFSPSAETLTIVLEKKEFHLYDLATGEAQMIRKHCRHDFVVFAPDGLRIATAPRKANGIEVWNSLINPESSLRPGQRPTSSPNHFSPLSAFSSDGSIAATAQQSQRNTLLLVDVYSKQILHKLQAYGVPEAVAFSADRRVVAAKTFLYDNNEADKRDKEGDGGKFTFEELFDDDIVVIEKDFAGPDNRHPCWLEVWKVGSNSTGTRPTPQFKKGFSMEYREAIFAVNATGTRVAFALSPVAGIARDADLRNAMIVEEWDVVNRELLCTHTIDQSFRVSKLEYTIDGANIDLFNYIELWPQLPSCPSTTAINTTIRTRIRAWQTGQGPRVRHPKWRAEQQSFPRTGIWVTEDEAWIQYNGHNILYIPGYLRPMQHVYLGTSFDAVCVEHWGSEVAVVGWVTIEGLLTTFQIDLARLRLCLAGISQGQ
ncbi:hypothetical protein AN3340.2 [Aspergillus nidulans FGSC A4]|uniref:Nephrocystin 3-like N-terminal domain-containing protein n=1 Tax=Emericella nidulans (strain FGSC A4 / ATCC 38163 / CBS 112.46 / NRRL 194 / M139) TaxID=227321 RepID=Q5B7Z0_EMENI|nr:hypothetical protein [Aspergillus nidulans FGSC A4]EAA63308.1 hypothetical protein AN3340.2 [Aspergillus nidulans FGSC A4]CBF82911.1 TPA: conserved hypothetical protein [Aspergillus nidulans FGSC A4]|eukprot:XP_660944.1 hypothetical protein AN3340.2 [Aspergillus nidulans FGSC A4]